MDDAQVTQFAVLWTQAQPSVFAFISAAVTDFADAEDVLQKTATAAVQKFEAYDSSRPFVAWAIGIARLEILAYLRGKSTDRHEFVADSLKHIARGFDAIASELEGRRAALADCLKQLRGRSRTVLEKRYGKGMSVSAIGEEMALTATNVSVILHRAHAALRKCIDRRLAAEER